MTPRALAVALVAGVLAGCGGGAGNEVAGWSAWPQRVTAVSNVLELRAAFNEDAGKPRLLLVLSPT
jgi:hypothetical protein